MDAETEDRLFAALRAIDHKLTILIDALAEEDEDPPQLTLDGMYAGSERDDTQPL